MQKELYFDSQKDYEEALEIYLTSDDSKARLAAWHRIFIDFKIAAFNVINRLTKHKLPVEKVDDYAFEIILQRLEKLKDERDKDKWPRKLATYLYLYCLKIFDKKHQFEDNIIYTDDLESLNV